QENNLVEMIFAELELERVIRNLERNNRSTLAGQSKHLSEDNHRLLIFKLGEKDTPEEITKLFDNIIKATTENDLKNAIEEIGLEPNDEIDIKGILAENKYINITAAIKDEGRSHLLKALQENKKTVIQNLSGSEDITKKISNMLDCDFSKLEESLQKFGILNQNKVKAIYAENMYHAIHEYISSNDPDLVKIVENKKHALQHYLKSIENGENLIQALKNALPNDRKLFFQMFPYDDFSKNPVLLRDTIFN